MLASRIEPFDARTKISRQVSINGTRNAGYSITFGIRYSSRDEITRISPQFYQGGNRVTALPAYVVASAAVYGSDVGTIGWNRRVSFSMASK